MGLSKLLPRPARAVPAVAAPTAEREPESPAAFQLRAVPVPETPERVMAKVIAFANQKGGVAKTTTTLNLGVALSELGKRVLLVDLDPQGNLTMSQGMNPDTIERSMFDVLVHRIPISDVIHTVEVDIAVSSIDLAGAELALSALPREGARRGPRPLRLHPPRHPALARAAHDQRLRRVVVRDRPRAVRVPLPARSRAAREHPRHGA
jgi:Mrp family chromosome partitioning ATPase